MSPDFGLETRREIKGGGTGVRLEHDAKTGIVWRDCFLHRTRIDRFGAEVLQGPRAGW